MAVELNERQREAVMHGDGPLLVLAGAGSGKTRVITTRIATLVDGGTSPRGILALTFTNKAAAEMRHRLGALLGGNAGELWMSTFHSAAAQILRRHIHHLGYTSSFSIFDEQDCAKLLRQCLAEEGIGEQEAPRPRSRGRSTAPRTKGSIPRRSVDDRSPVMPWCASIAAINGC